MAPLPVPSYGERFRPDRLYDREYDTNDWYDDTFFGASD
jgi:hypothetical protein